MKRTAISTSALTLAALVAALMWTSCDIITGPDSQPAPAESVNWNFSGTIVDQDGHPLQGVRLSTDLGVPVKYGEDSVERPVRTLGRTFKISERGTSLHLTFSKQGYLDASYTLERQNPGLVYAETGKQGDWWPLKDNFPVVMLTSTPDITLHFTGDVAFGRHPSTGINLLGPQSSNDEHAPIRADNPAALPAGVLYFTVVEPPPAHPDTQGAAPPIDALIPEKVTLHITGPGSGFIRIEPHLGFAPMQTSDTAPQGPYALELSLDHERLKKLCTYEVHTVPDAAEYFFFRAGDHYGKGRILWPPVQSQDAYEGHFAQLDYDFWIQPKLGDRNLQSHGDK